MTHYYYGNGKGKTTAALGMAVRAAGHGLPVCVVQFLKGSFSGEVKSLGVLPQVTLIRLPKDYGFSFQMTQQQMQEITAQPHAGISCCMGQAASGWTADPGRDRRCGGAEIDRCRSGEAACDASHGGTDLYRTCRTAAVYRTCRLCDRMQMCTASISVRRPGTKRH